MLIKDLRFELLSLISNNAIYLCIPLKLMEEFSQLENKLVSSKQKASYYHTKNIVHFL